MVWLLHCAKNLKICLFVLTWSTHITDRHCMTAIAALMHSIAQQLCYKFSGFVFFLWTQCSIHWQNADLTFYDTFGLHMGCRHASFVFYICTCLIVLCSICTLQPDSTPFNELENFTPEKEVSSHFDIVKHFLTFLYLGFVTLLHQPGTVFGLSCTTGPIKKIGNSLMDSFWTWTCIGSDAVLKTFLSHDAMH